MKRSSLRIVRQQVEGLLLERGLRPHDRLPSERVMCELFGCNRVTLHKAILQLCGERLLYIRPSSGAYVSERPIERNLWELRSFTDAVGVPPERVGNRLLEFTAAPAKLQICRVFQLPAGEEMVLLSRLRLIDGEPVALDRSYVPHRLCPGILACDMEKERLFDLLETRYGMKALYGRRELEVARPRKKDRQLLGLSDDDPALLIRAFTFGKGGVVLEYTEQLARGDRFVFLSELEMKG